MLFAGNLSESIIEGALLSSLLLVLAISLYSEFNQEEVSLEPNKCWIFSHLLLLLTTTLILNVFRSSSEFKDKVLFSNVIIVLIISSYTDLKRRVVPNIYILYLISVWLFISFVSFLGEGETIDFAEKIIFLLVYIIITLLIYFSTKKGVGMGDIKIMAILTLYFNKPLFLQLIALLSLIVFLFAVIMLILRSIKMRDAKYVDSIPLLPFLFVSCVFVMIF